MSRYIETGFSSPVDSNTIAAFEAATTFWNSVITTGHSGVTFSQDVSLSNCGLDSVLSTGEYIRGLRIYGSALPIDGEGSILAQAGPCLSNGNFPLVGVVQLDTADATNLRLNGHLEEVVKHEMGLVLGFGSLWQSQGFVRNQCTGRFGLCEGSPSYLGVGGLEGFADLPGFSSEDSVTDVSLVENVGGEGTWNIHWNEEVFGNELMTGFLDFGVPNYVSVMTIKALSDLGYGVNLNAAEPYVLPSPVQRDFGIEKVQFFGDLLAFDLKDYREELSAGEETIGDDNVIIDDDSDLTNEFGGLFSLMVIGFLAMAGMMYMYSRRQSAAIENIVASMNVNQNPSDKRVGTKNELYIEP